MYYKLKYEMNQCVQRIKNRNRIKKLTQMEEFWLDCDKREEPDVVDVIDCDWLDPLKIQREYKFEEYDGEENAFQVINPLFLIKFYEKLDWLNEDVVALLGLEVIEWDNDSLFKILKDYNDKEYNELYTACCQFAALYRWKAMPQVHAGRFVVESFTSYTDYLEQVK